MVEQLVTFKLGQEEFGISIMNVQEIIKIVPITRVPKAPRYIEGVINLRGNIIPVINLQERFSTSQTPLSPEARIIVIQVGGRTLGIMVDQVTEVLHLPTDVIEPPPAISLGIDTSHIRGVGKINERLIILVDVEKIIDREQLGNHE